MSVAAHRVITDAMGGSALSQAAQTRRLPAAIQPWWPAGAERWRDHAAHRRHTAASSWHEHIAPAIAAGGAAGERLARVVRERGVVVTTGQQAALFGGPVYTLAKALTAIALADAIEERLGIAAAPVFWGATDDADFAEASIAYVAGADGLQVLELPNRPPAGTTMAATRLTGVGPLLAGLRRACGSGPHREYLELAESCFDEASSLGDGYVKFLRELLEPLGMAVLDSSHAAYRSAARPLLEEALQRAPEIARSLSDIASAIRSAGFEPQVQDDRGLSLVFEVKNGVKQRVSIDDAKKRVARRRGDFAPNVLLRPLVERELLPTVAYVAGPGELAYFAQSSAVAHVMDRDPVVAVPRWSCTVIEPFAARALARLGVEWHELRDLHAVERRLARASLPEAVAQAVRRLHEETRTSVQLLREAVRASGLTTDAVVDGIESSLAHRLARGERRLLAAAKRREERVRLDLAVAGGALFPHGSRQERMLNYVPMLARGGGALLDEMRRQAGVHARSMVQVAHAAPAPAR